VYDTTYQSKIINQTEDTDLRGGDSGKPGAGGKGGNHGIAVLLPIDRDFNSIFQIKINPGAEGDKGKLGTAGKGGSLEYYEGVYREEKMFPTVRKIFGSDSVKEFDKNITETFVNKVHVAVASNVALLAIISSKLTEEEDKKVLVKELTLGIARTLSKGAIGSEINMSVLKLFVSHVLEQFSKEDIVDIKQVISALKSETYSPTGVNALMKGFADYILECRELVKDIVKEEEYKILIKMLYRDTENPQDELVNDAFNLIADHPMLPIINEDIIRNFLCSEIKPKLEGFYKTQQRIENIVVNSYKDFAQKVFNDLEPGCKSLTKYVFSMIIGKNPDIPVSDFTDEIIRKTLNTLKEEDLQETQTNIAANFIGGVGHNAIKHGGISLTVGGVANMLLKQSVLNTFSNALTKTGVVIAQETLEQAVTLLVKDLVQAPAAYLAKEIVAEATKSLGVESAKQVADAVSKQLIKEGLKEVAGEVLISGATSAGVQAGEQVAKSGVASFTTGAGNFCKNAFSVTSIAITFGIQTGLSLVAMFSDKWISPPEKLSIVNYKNYGKQITTPNDEGIESPADQIELNREDLIGALGKGVGGILLGDLLVEDLYENA
jgi:hypothetical protein